MSPPLWLPASLIGLFTLLWHLMPRLTRPDLFFAVTVPRAFARTVVGKKTLRRYRAQIWAHSLVGLLLVALGTGFGSPVVAMLGPAWQLLGATCALVDAHRITLAHAAGPSPIREAELAPRRGKLPGGIALGLGPFVLLAGAAVALHLHWDQLPARVPVHWGLNGAPDRWADRTAAVVYGALVADALLCGVLLATCYGLFYATRRIAVTGPAARHEARFRHIIILMLIALQYLIILPGLWFALYPLRAMAGLSLLFPISMAVAVLAVLGILIHMGQGGSRLRAPAGQAAEEPAVPIGDRTPDACWKWGIFYFNPDDPAILVEKRFGIGYTINFGNRWSWVILAALLIPLLALAIWMP